jgi:4-hydroxybenzoate polyprenyltransferase
MTPPRWYIYQRERFPIVGNGALILAFATGAVCFSATLRATQQDTAAHLTVRSVVVAFVSAFLFFYLLRVADEHKDLEDDTQWRPYRPVPRGLVTLRELRWTAYTAIAIQATLAAWLEPRLLALLLLVWGYLWLMTNEFWMRNYLRHHPVTTLWTHMLIIPLIDLYATACDWMTQPNGSHVVRTGLVWFLVASFFNGIVVEIGRKIRAPHDEEPGVETYSALWGRHRAVLAWLGVMLTTTGCAVAAATHVGATAMVATTLGIILMVSLACGVRFMQSPLTGHGKRIEVLAGVWTLALYLTVGVIPFFQSR